jgi:hypothetical protein
MKNGFDQVSLPGESTGCTAADVTAWDPLENAALLRDHGAFTAHVASVLQERSLHGVLYPPGLSRADSTSAVLFLIGPHCDLGFEPCVLLNKRSGKVKQPGDLCFPGSCPASFDCLSYRSDGGPIGMPGGLTRPRRPRDYRSCSQRAFARRLRRCDSIRLV